MFITPEAVRMAKVMREFDCMKQLSDRDATFAIPLKQFYAVNVILGIQDIGDSTKFINAFVREGINAGGLLDPISKDNPKLRGERLFKRTTWKRYAGVMNDETKLIKTTVKTVDGIADAVSSFAPDKLVEFWEYVVNHHSYSLQDSYKKLVAFTDTPRPGPTVEDPQDPTTACFAIVDLNTFCGCYTSVMARSPGFLRYGSTIRTRATMALKGLSSIACSTLSNTLDGTEKALTSLLKRSGNRNELDVTLTGGVLSGQYRLVEPALFKRHELERRIVDGIALPKDVVRTDGLTLVERGAMLDAILDNSRENTDTIQTAMLANKESTAAQTASYREGVENMASKETRGFMKLRILSEGSVIPRVELCTDKDDEAIARRDAQKRKLAGLELETVKLENKVDKFVKKLKKAQRNLEKKEAARNRASLDPKISQEAMAASEAAVAVQKAVVDDMIVERDKLRATLYESRRKTKNAAEMDRKLAMQEVKRRLSKEAERAQYKDEQY